MSTRSISVVVYDQVNRNPRTVAIPLEQEYLHFFQNKSFCAQTGYPLIAQSVYNPRFCRFIDIGSFMSLKIDTSENPWLVVRRAQFEDEECLGLASGLKKLHRCIGNDGTGSRTFAMEDSVPWPQTSKTNRQITGCNFRHVGRNSQTTKNSGRDELHAIEITDSEDESQDAVIDISDSEEETRWEFNTQDPLDTWFST
ncbi:hypothetical protein NP233_g3328 [Leucocoprinus birnbaumii]|uniref:Uncharacterized protein n=1 Tax=Leucocoprinus birnbaumii TaxID=56174 RepID=A0AAD5VZB7_9AGAR|nr:hypothetical protein NP233_g3328 [Leucocoprinus birnbaumii]